MKNYSKKNSIKVLSISLLLAFATFEGAQAFKKNSVSDELTESCNDVSNALVIKPNFGKKSEARDLTKDEVSKTFVQIGTKDSEKFLRFATAVRYDDDSPITSLNYVRDAIDGDHAATSKKVTELYKSIQGDGSNYYYYDATNKVLTTQEQSNDFYFACYTIKIGADSKYLGYDITARLEVNEELNSAEMCASFTTLEGTNHMVSFFNGDELVGRKVVADGQTFTATPTASKEGYVFQGYAETNNGEVVTTFPSVTEDVNYYAVFEHDHQAFTKHNATEATINTIGNIEYWTCSGCDEIFADAEGKTKITLDQTKIFIPEYLGVGQKVTLVDGYTYEIVTGTGATVNATTLDATAAGDIQVKVSKGDFEATFDSKVIDFGQTTGSIFDLATDASLWNYRNFSNDNDVTITKETSVGDSRATAYTFNALKYTRPSNTGASRATSGNLMYLKPAIFARARELGYKYFSFTVLSNDTVGTTPTYIEAYNVNANGSLHYENDLSKAIYSVANSSKWTRYAISLDDSKLHVGAGFGIATYGRYLYLAQVEFTGADISAYANNYLTVSSDNNKSSDMIQSDLVGKMFVSTCNASTVNYLGSANTGKETALGGGDAIQLVKTGYLGAESGSLNALKIPADWIKAAKGLGYTMIGVYTYSTTANPITKMGFLKQNGTGTSKGLTAGTTQFTSTASLGFVSISLSIFEEGDSLIAASQGSGVGLTGLTFRKTGTPSLTKTVA